MSLSVPMSVCGPLLPFNGFLPLVWLCRLSWPGFRPGGRPTFFAGAKNVGKESTFEHAHDLGVAIDRCAPAGDARALAKPRSTGFPVRIGQVCARHALEYKQPGRRSLRLSRRLDGQTGPGADVITPGRDSGGAATRWQGTPVERGFARASRPPAGAQRSVTTP